MDKFDIPEPKKIAPQLTVEQRQAMAPLDLLVQYIMPKLWDKVNYLEWAVKAELHSVRESIETLQVYADKIGADADSNILRMGERVSEVERGLDRISQVNQKMLAIVHDGPDRVAASMQAQAEEKPKRTRRKKADDKSAENSASLMQPLESEPRAAMVEEDISEPVAMSTVAVYNGQTDQWEPKTIDGVAITAEVVRAVLAGEASYPMDVMTFVYDLSESERKVLCATFPDETTEE